MTAQLCRVACLTPKVLSGGNFAENVAGFQLGVTDENGALRDGVDVLILPDGIRLLTPEERRSQERAAGDRLGSAKAKLFASALPARAAKATGGQGTPCDAGSGPEAIR